MARYTTLQPDRYYHFYISAQSDAVLFKSSAEYTHFLKHYANLIEPVAQTFAYCLLPNHFHFFVRIKTIREQIEDWYYVDSAETIPPEFIPIDPNNQLDQLLATLPAKHLSLNIVEVGSPLHYAYLVRYIHQNPSQHNIINDFRLWPHTSYHAILERKQTRIPVETVLKWFHTDEWYEEIHWETQNPTQIGYLILED